MKKYLFGILAITLAVGFSAFTTKNAKKPPVSKTIYFGKFMTNQRVELGQYSDPDPEKHTIIPSVFTVAANWQFTAPSGFALYTSGSSSFVGSFDINDWQTDDASDGNNGNGISKAEAVAQLSSSLTSMGEIVFPTTPSTNVNLSSGVVATNFQRRSAALY